MAMAMAMAMVITTVSGMIVAITITAAITVGKDAAIAADVGLVLVVAAVAVEKTALMTVIVDHHEEALSCVTKIPVDNNTNSNFSYNSQTSFFTLAYTSYLLFSTIIFLRMG